MDGQASDGRTGFDAYVEALIGVIGHADRATPLRDYCLVLMMPLARKRVELPARVSAKHQSLLHFVRQSPWSDAALIVQVRDWVLPRMIRRGGPITAWIVDDTSFSEEGQALGRRGASIFPSRPAAKKAPRKQAGHMKATDQRRRQNALARGGVHT